MDSSDRYLKDTLGKVVTVILYILRWVSLCMAVVVVGFTIGLIIMTFVNGSDTSTNLVAKMMSLITYYSKPEIIDYISSIGKTKVVIAGIGYGLAYSIRYYMEYKIIANLLVIYKSLLNENLYVKDNVKMINKTLPLTFIATFLNPVIINIVNIGTTLFNEYDYNVSPMVYICIVYALKLMIEKGYNLNTENDALRREISEKRREASELKMELYKQNNAITELTEYKEKVETKIALEKTKKRAAAKKEKEALKKETTKTKKVAPKKETTKTKKVEKIAKTTKTKKTTKK